MHNFANIAGVESSHPLQKNMTFVENSYLTNLINMYRCYFLCSLDLKTFNAVLFFCGQELDKNGHGHITTEVLEGQRFFYTEDRHQQYLKKVPKGYSHLRGTSVSGPIEDREDDQ